MPVYIAGASQSRGPSKSALIPDTYVTYEIRSKDGSSTTRRYTEFEGLQAHLFRTYPRSIIPPIPAKENITDYFAKYLAGKSNEINQKVIQQRIRALQVFLDYIDGHPVLSKDECYIKFLADTPNWISTELKTESPAPVSSSAVNDPETMGKIEGLQQTLEIFEKSQSKLLRGLKDAVKGYSDLGTALNGFSLEETGASKELDSAGTAFDVITNQSHEIIENQTILVETVQLCQQFCVSIQRASQSNADNGAEEQKVFQDEVTLAVKLIESLLETAVKATVKSNGSYYKHASNQFSSFQL